MIMKTSCITANLILGILVMRQDLTNIQMHVILEIMIVVITTQPGDRVVLSVDCDHQGLIVPSGVVDYQTSSAQVRD